MVPVSSVWFFKHQFSFFSFSFCRYCIVKNKSCVFLAGTLNGFCFIGNALSVSSEAYLEPSQASMMELFAKIGSLSCWLFLHKSCITDVWQGPKFASDHNTVTFSTQNSLWKLFLENYNKKGDMSNKFAFFITAHQRTRNLQVGKNHKTYPLERQC